MNVLVIEDERNLADAICEILRSDGFTVEAAYDGISGSEKCLSGDYACVILDLMLPGKDGMDIMREPRKSSNETPVLVLTAKDSMADKVAGLDCGADDYMTKPFEAVELSARVRALTRRSRASEAKRTAFGDLTLDHSTHDILCKDARIHLSHKEFDVMGRLIEAQGAVVSKQELLDEVWGADTSSNENSVEAYISFLRKKLAHIKSAQRIVTLRMVGYRLEQKR